MINTKKNTKSSIAILNINDLFSIEKYQDVDQVYFMEPLFLDNNQIKYYLDYIYYLFNEPNKLKNLEFNYSSEKRKKLKNIVPKKIRFFIFLLFRFVRSIFYTLNLFWNK